jgi:hypothetical protein
VLFNKDRTTLIRYPAGKSGKYSIPAGVADIEGGAFEGCARLSDITIPAEVTSIWDSAFYRCAALTGITIPAGVTRIGDSAFSGCAALASVTFEADSSLDYIGNYAFTGCAALRNISIPKGVTYIGYRTFSGCSVLGGINVDRENSNYSSEDGVLFDKTKETLIKCPEGKSGLCTIPASVTGIVYEAFYDCAKLTGINVEEGNNTYSSEDGVLFDKAKETLIKYPGGKSGAYTIPAGVTSIREGAFFYCAALTGVRIPAGVIDIGEGAFAGCAKLTGIIVDGENGFYSSKDGVLFDKAGETLVQYPAGKSGEYSIPAGVLYIGNSAFRGHYGLTSVRIPETVTGIGYNAFAYCKALGSVSIPVDLTVIRGWAFHGCAALTSVTFAGDGVSVRTEVFPEGSSGYGGDTLRDAYLAGGAGTYTRTAGGGDWAKRP